MRGYGWGDREVASRARQGAPIQVKRLVEPGRHRHRRVRVVGRKKKGARPATFRGVRRLAGWAGRALVAGMCHFRVLVGRACRESDKALAYAQDVQAFGQRGEATVFGAVCGGFFAEPDFNDVCVAVGTLDPDRASGVAGNAV